MKKLIRSFLFLVVFVLFTFFKNLNYTMKFFDNRFNITVFKSKILRSNYEIKCKLLFEANPDEVRKAQNILTSNNYEIKVIPDENFIFNSSICWAYRNVFNEINDLSVTQEELDFPIAFAILTYEHAEQIHRLLELIYRPQNFYCIHIDSKSSKEYRKAIESMTSCFDNVIIASKSEYIVWGGFGILQAELNCMKDLLNKSQTWKYLIHMSGNELPLKTNYELVKILKLYNGTNDVEIIDDFHSRYIYKHVLTSDNKSVMGLTETKSPPPHNYKIAKGSTNCAISRKFVEYVLTDEKVRDLIDWSKDMYIPDEM